MTSTLLVPLVVGAMVAKGCGEKVTTENRPKGHGSSHDGLLRISGRWVRDFCKCTLNMSFRRPTRSHKHDHAESVLKSVGRLFLLRLAFLVHHFNVPKELTVNMDETGVYLMPLRTQNQQTTGRYVLSIWAYMYAHVTWASAIVHV